MLIEYYRKPGSRIKKGVMIAVPNLHEIRVDFGYSLCNLGLDNFDKEIGINLAIRRAIIDRPIKIPQSMEKAMNRFQTRCKKYYKQFHPRQL